VAPQSLRSSDAVGWPEAKAELPDPEICWIGGKNFRLDRNYRYHDTRNARVITVSAGFVFDLSSVPRLLWFLIAPFELSVVAPLLHDLLYRYGGDVPDRAAAVEPRHRYTRAATDRLFLAAMAQERVAPWRRHSAYVAVRVFGCFAWRRSEPRSTEPRRRVHRELTTPRADRPATRTSPL